MRNCWHVSTSPHHFLSCSTAVSLGHQVVIAGKSPRMVFSHKRRLVEPHLPKYIPFTQVDSFVVLKFDIPAQESLSPWPDPATTHSVFTLQASYPSHPFASLATLAFNPSPESPQPASPTP